VSTAALCGELKEGLKLVMIILEGIKHYINQVRKDVMKHSTSENYPLEEYGFMKNAENGILPELRH